MVQREDFQIGDRVICIDRGSKRGSYVDNNPMIKTGMTGTVRKFRDYTDIAVGVEWDENVRSHNLGGLCEWGYGYYVHPNALQVLSDTDTIDGFDTPAEIVDLF